MIKQTRTRTIIHIPISLLFALSILLSGIFTIYTSLHTQAAVGDYTNWHQATGAHNIVGDTLSWSSITSSADGTKLAAVAYSGYIYTSTDSGATSTWGSRVIHLFSCLLLMCYM